MGVAREIAQELADSYAKSLAGDPVGILYAGDNRRQAIEGLRNANTFDDIYEAFKIWHSAQRAVPLNAYVNMLTEDCPLFQRFFGGYDSVDNASEYYLSQPKCRFQRGMKLPSKYYWKWLDIKAKEIDSKLGGGDMIGALGL